jgi:hypothetical protein
MITLQGHRLQGESSRGHQQVTGSAWIARQQISKSRDFQARPQPIGAIVVQRTISAMENVKVWAGDHPLLLLCGTLSIGLALGMWVERKRIHGSERRWW